MFVWLSTLISEATASYRFIFVLYKNYIIEQVREVLRFTLIVNSTTEAKRHVKVSSIYDEDGKRPRHAMSYFQEYLTSVLLGLPYCECSSTVVATIF